MKVDFEGQPCFLHCLVSVGRLLRSGFDVNLSSKKPNTLETPDGLKVPITRHGSLLFLRPTLAPFNKEEFEVACNTFHTQSAQGTIVAPVFRPVVQYHIDKWELSGFDPHTQKRKSYFLFSRRDERSPCRLEGPCRRTHNLL